MAAGWRRRAPANSCQHGMSGDDLTLNRAVTTGAAWTHGAFLAGKLIVFGNTIVLARLLMPEDFGLVAIGLVVLAYMDTISEAGVSAAVVWHNDDPEKIASVAMTVSLLMAFLVGGLTYLSAPVIADFFGEPDARQIVRVLAVSFIFTSPALVYSSLLQRRFEFRRRVIPELAKSISKGVVGIGLAFAGFGAWSLVYGHLAGVVVALLAFMAISRWRASLSLDPAILREILPFGLQIMLIGLIGIAIKNVDYFVIGHYFDAKLLGIYYLAFTIIDHIVMGICWAASQSLFPAFSKIRSDAAKLREFYGLCLFGVAALTLPAAGGIVVVAEPMIHVLYGSNWSEAVPVIQALALYAMIYSVGFNLGDIYKAWQATLPDLHFAREPGGCCSCHGCFFALGNPGGRAGTGRSRQFHYDAELDYRSARPFHRSGSAVESASIASSGDGRHGDELCIARPSHHA